MMLRTSNYRKPSKQPVSDKNELPGGSGQSLGGGRKVTEDACADSEPNL